VRKALPRRPWTGRLDVDPWKEAVNLARMPREQAMERLTSLIASLPKGATASLSPELVAASLIALLPRAAGFNAPAASAPLRIARTQRMRLFIGVGVLALLLVGYFILTARASNAPGAITDGPSTTSEPAARR